MNVTKDVRDSVLKRANYQCEFCHGSLHAMSIHHRGPRQLGGSKASYINEAVNLLALCGSGTTGCHGEVESNRARAYELGLLVHRGYYPENVPYFDKMGHWWLLHEDTKIAIEFPFPHTTPGLTS